MFGRRKNRRSGNLKITTQKPVSRRSDRQMDYFRATVDEPYPSATSGIETFRGKKKR